MAVTPPTIVPNSGRPPEDDLDGLLRTYFQAEMPDPWPSFAAPASRNGVLPLRRPMTPRWTLWRSRLALAASILLLIAAALFLSAGSRSNDDPNRSGLPGTPTAKRDLLPGNGTNIVVDPKNGARIEIREPLDFPMK